MLTELLKTRNPFLVVPGDTPEIDKLAEAENAGLETQFHDDIIQRAVSFFA